MSKVFRVVSLAAAWLIILCAVAVGQTHTVPTVFVDVDEVEGLTPDGKIPDGGTIVIPIRFFNMDASRTFIKNYYEILTDDASWSGISAAWNPEYPWDWSLAIQLGIFPPYFDQGLFIHYAENQVGMIGLTGQSGSGLPQDFNGIAHLVTISDISGPDGATLILDSLLCMLSCDQFSQWGWDGWDPSIPAWDGPYEFEIVSGSPPVVYTTCWPQPTILKALENDRILNVAIHDEVIEDVVFESILVQGKIPPYTEAAPYVDGDSIVTDCFVLQFLGISGFRPIPPTGVHSEYTVEYDKYSGVHVILTGDFNLDVLVGDVTLDGQVNADDIVFMSQYFWHGGPKCDIEEFMDVDDNGRVDIRDFRRLIEITGI